MRTQIINDLMTNIFFNLIETEDRIAADDRFEGLSGNDLRVLTAIGTNEPKCMKEVAEYLRVKKQTVNHTTKALINKGLAYKKVSPENGRYTWIILTDKGVDFVNYYRTLIRDAMKTMTDDMTEEQADILIQGLSKMNRYLNARSIDGTTSAKRKK